MKHLFLCTLFFITGFFSFSQISSLYVSEADALSHSYAQNIDSTVALRQNSFITYSHDSLFRCIHLTNEVGEIFNLDLVMIDDYRGYLKLYLDLEESIIVESRGDGSGNPSYFYKIEKSNGIRKLIGQRNN